MDLLCSLFCLVFTMSLCVSVYMHFVAQGLYTFGEYYCCCLSFRLLMFYIVN